MLNLSRRSAGGLAAAACCAVVAVATQAGAHGSNGRSDTTNPAQLAHPRVVAAEVASHFKVFRKPRTAADALTSAAQAVLPDADSISGRNNALARRLGSVGGAAWAIPGNSQLCLAVQDSVSAAGVACDENADVQRHGVDLETVTVGDPVVPFTALLPDDSTATVRYANGATKQLKPDSDGVVTARLTGARTVTMTGPAGVRTIQIPDPLAPLTVGP